MNKDSLTTALARFILKLEQHARSTHAAEDRPLYGKFLARAAIIMAKILEDKPIADDIDSLRSGFLGAPGSGMKMPTDGFMQSGICSKVC